LNVKEEKLVKNIALKLYRKYCPRKESGVFTTEDLFHYGIIGFLKAKKGYKEKKGVPFNAYAAIRINGEIMDALRKSPLIRLPQQKRSKVKQLEQAKKDLLSRGIAPDPDAVSQELGWDKEQVLKTESLLSSLVSIDDNHSMGNLIFLQSKELIEQKVLNKDLAQMIQRCMEQIDDDIDRLIFVARDLEDMSLKQVGMRFGFSIEKARQKHISAKESMKSCLERNDWDLK
jgi:RNA polymerase sigma factor FliA